MSDGKFDEMKGRAKEAAGDLTDNDDLRTKARSTGPAARPRIRSKRPPTRSRTRSTPTGSRPGGGDGDHRSPVPWAPGVAGVVPRRGGKLIA
jgi:hypothetical protein